MLNDKMTPKEFCIWLKGFLSAVGEGEIPSAQSNILKQKLDDVFDHSEHVTFNPPPYGPFPQSNIVQAPAEAKGFMLPDHMNPDVTYGPDEPRPRC